MEEQKKYTVAVGEPWGSDDVHVEASEVICEEKREDSRVRRHVIIGACALMFLIFGVVLAYAVIGDKEHLVKTILFIATVFVACLLAWAFGVQIKLKAVFRAIASISGWA